MFYEFLFWLIAVPCTSFRHSIGHDTFCTVCNFVFWASHHNYPKCAEEAVKQCITENN